MKRQSFARFLSMVGRYWPVLALAYLFTFADKVVDSVVLSSVIRTIADGAFAQDVAIVKRAAYCLALVGLARAVFSASAKYLVSVAGGRAALTMRSLILRTSLNAAEVAASTVITPGTAVGLVQLSTRALFPFASIGSMWAGLQANLAAFDKVCQAMEIPQEEGADARGFDVADSAPSPIAALPPEVSFENVSFRYEDKKVLDSVSFQIPPGRKAALIGPSGSGKSTILNVLLGLYGYQDGSVRVDDRELRSLPVNALRRMISFVPQDPWLFPGTIRENIALGNRDAALENVIRAATLANAHDFIVKLPNGYDTVLDERGSNLSGGEKQRICLARAFLKGGSLLLLDEPTSSVDGESEKLIVQALNSYCPGRTVVMVSHNAEMCADADIVLQLEDGRLASATPVASAE